MRVVVYGSRPDGHAGVVVELFADQLELVGLLDDHAENQTRTVGSLRVIGGRQDLGRLRRDGIEGLVIGFGSAPGRSEIVRLAHDAGLELPVLVHAQAIVANRATLGEGVQLLPGSQVGPGCELADGVLVNAGAILSHDVHAGEGAVIDPGAVLAGRARVGAGSEIGSGAVLLPDTRVGAAAAVGAGAVVTRDVPDGVTVTGVPARPVQPSSPA